MTKVQKIRHGRHDIQVVRYERYGKVRKREEEQKTTQGEGERG